jgi:hypothetical protein
MNNVLNLETMIVLCAKGREMSSERANEQASKQVRRIHKKHTHTMSECKERRRKMDLGLGKFAHSDGKK